MKIIRDEETGGLMMIPLFVDWYIRRCNVKGCTRKPSTILAQMPNDLPIAGMCEEHFQAANKPDGGQIYDFEWDEFDAFAAANEASE